MKIETENGGRFIEVTPRSAKPSPVVNYSLVGRSDGKYVSIDRGVTADRYTSVFVFSGEKEFIESLRVAFLGLRSSLEPVTLYEIEDRYFGDNVDYTGTIECVIGDIGKTKSNKNGVLEFSIGLTASNLQFIGNSNLPDLNYLQQMWEGYEEWNTSVKETYDRNNFFVDNGADKIYFKGKYVLTRDQNSSLFNFWRLTRGEEFRIVDGDFGVARMFGAGNSDNWHDVIIGKISYTNNSPLMREVTIELVKVGGEVLFLPIFTVQPVDQVVALGGTALFECEVTGDFSSTLQWRRSARNTFFRSGSVDHQFDELEWSEIQASTAISWDGDSVTLTGGFWDSDYSGTPSKSEVHTSCPTISAIRHTHMLGLSEATNNLIVWYDASSSTVYFVSRKNNINTIITESIPLMSTLKTVTVVNVVGTDWVISAKMYDLSGTLIHDFTKTLVNEFNPLVEYKMFMNVYNGTATYDYMNTDGVGFPNVEYLPKEDLVGETGLTLSRPNIGTTGDNVGDIYDCVGTSEFGTDTTNEVTTIEQ